MFRDIWVRFPFSFYGINCCQINCIFNVSKRCSGHTPALQWWTAGHFLADGIPRCSCHLWVFLFCSSDWYALDLFYYRPQRSCEGYVFTGVCLSTGGGSAPRGSVCSGGCLVQGGLLPGGWYPSMHWGRPPWRDGYCCGRYASYWNAFLFEIIVP